MNPLRFQDEAEYYDRIIRNYKEIKAGNNNRSFETFAYREIILILKELKELEKENDEINQIFNNSLILILALLNNGSSENYFCFSELDNIHKQKIKEVVIQSIYI